MKKLLVFLLTFVVMLSSFPTVDAMADVEEQTSLEIYPFNVGIAYYNYAIAIPEIAFHSLGAENGLEGTICVFDGEVKTIKSIDAAGIPMEYATVETDMGMVLVLNMHPGIIAETVAKFSENVAREMFSDKTEYYILPRIGEHVRFIGTYMGYSQNENMPSFYLGASADIYAMMQIADPVAEILEKKISTLHNELLVIEPLYADSLSSADSRQQADNLVESTAEAAAQAVPEPTPEPASVGTNYVLNKNTKKFHYPSCGSVKKMNESNKGDFFGTRDELLVKGYDPCGNCRP